MTHVKGKTRHDEQQRAYRDASIVTAGCCHCRRWKMTGPLSETRDAFFTHRREAHPNLPRPRTRIQLKAGAWQTGSKRIEENIANARTHGARAANP